MTQSTPRNTPPNNDIGTFARRLAKVHRSDEDGDSQILVSWTDEEVRLIEIADHFPPSEAIMPFHFAAQPDKNIPYESVILLHNTETWRNAADRSELLPEGWDLDDFESLEELD